MASISHIHCILFFVGVHSFRMRDREADERWIRERLGKTVTEAVYMSPNHYDAGYEVRVGSVDFFVDYESIDANDDAIIRKYLPSL